MKMSRTWQGRIEGARSKARRVGAPIVVVLAAIAGLNTLWQFFFGAPPDIAGPARTAVNKAAVVSSFAQDFVNTWLTATCTGNGATTPTQMTTQSCSASELGALTQFVSLDTSAVRLPSTPAVVVSTPTVMAVTLVGTAGDAGQAEVWSTVISVLQRPYESATPERALYRVPVLWSRYGPRASTLPARISGPGAGADLPLAYPAALSATEKVYEITAGFLNALLTSAGGVERYVTADSLLIGLGDVYQSVQVDSVKATSASLPTIPAEGQTVRVLAQVNATTSQYAPTQLTYPLTLTGVGGRWLVAAIDQAPAVSATDDLLPAQGGQG